MAGKKILHMETKATLTSRVEALEHDVAGLLRALNKLHAVVNKTALAARDYCDAK